MTKRKLSGIVTSNKMEKTIVVRVETIKKHPKYKRRYKTHKTYKVHTDKDFNIGDRVIIVECKPISKDKKFEIIDK